MRPNKPWYHIADADLEKLCANAPSELWADKATTMDQVALSLRHERAEHAAARERIAQLENPGRTQYCRGCEERAKRIGDLEATIESDRSKIADAITELKAKLTGWNWLTEGRGSYEWDDDRYREEFAAASASFLEAIRPLERVAADWSNCPKTAAEIALARTDMKARIAELEQGIAAIGSAMGSDRLTPGEIERLIYRGNNKSLEMTQRIAAQESELTETRRDAEQLLDLAQKLFDQLEHCGWGDSYERECSEQLRDQAHDQLEKRHAAAAKGGQRMPVSDEVVIMTKRELGELQDKSFQRGVFRGEFEAGVRHRERIAELEAALLEARKDGERLDWLDSVAKLGNEFDAVRLYSPATILGASALAKDAHANVRDAIDADIAAAAAEGETK